jgi:hypothetical protein
MPFNPAEFAADVDSRARANPNEDPVLTRLVVLRVVMNHEFGAHEFAAFDHELATIERLLSERFEALPSAQTQEIAQVKKVPSVRWR